jgi:hypothetical protein
MANKSKKELIDERAMERAEMFESLFILHGDRPIHFLERYRGMEPKDQIDFIYFLKNEPLRDRKSKACLADIALQQPIEAHQKILSELHIK